jgi:hypothetical protein
MTNVIKLGESSTDSFKLRLQVSKLEGYDRELQVSKLEGYDRELSALFETTTTNTDTGESETEAEWKRRAKIYECNKYNYRASFSTNIRVSATEFTDVIIILINSKQLKERYFEGITRKNINVIYKEIIKLGIVDCSLSAFLNGQITDIDFKKDWRLKMDEYKEVIKACEIMTKESPKSDIGCRPFKDKDNYGIQWSVRQSTKYLTNPFLKIYSKDLELMKPTEKEGSNDFYNEYLKGYDITNLKRIETTVKNKKHFESLNLGVKTNSLKDILNLSQESMNKILSISVNAHLSSRIKARTFTDKTNMTPDKRLILNSILGYTTELNWSMPKIESLLLNGIENKFTKSKKKKLINELYNDYINKTDYDFKRSKVNSFFDEMQWF